MKRLVYSPVYRKKIRRLRQYLDFQFGEAVRQKALQKIDERLHMLLTFDALGISVRENFGIDCDYFCIYVAQNYIFYRVDDTRIYIVNIYNEREDFMLKMFGIRTVFEDVDI